MTESIYSHKNRKYKPLTEQCMNDLLSFYNDIEKIIEADGAWSLEDLKTPIETFSRSVAHILNRGEENPKSQLTVTVRGARKIKKYNLHVGGYIFELSKNEIKTIYKILKNIKESIQLGKNEREHANHFLFLGEQREISSNIVNELNALPKRNLAGMVKGTLIPAKKFEERAIKSIKTGSDYSAKEDGLEIFTTTNFSYVLIPLSEVGYEILQAFHGKNNRKPEKLREPVSLGGYTVQLKFRIPSIFNEEFERLTQVVFSLLIQYYVSFHNFDEITTCRECNKLIFKNTKGLDLCLSKKKNSCYGKYWKIKNPRSASKTNCRKNQNIWIERNTGRNSLWEPDPKKPKELGPKDLKLEPKACLECTVKKYPPGGQCPLLRKNVPNFDEIVEEYHNKEKGYREAMRS